MGGSSPESWRLSSSVFIVEAGGSTVALSGCVVLTESSVERRSPGAHPPPTRLLSEECN